MGHDEYFAKRREVQVAGHFYANAETDGKKHDWLEAERGK